VKICRTAALQHRNTTAAPQHCSTATPPQHRSTIPLFQLTLLLFLETPPHEGVEQALVGLSKPVAHFGQDA
jgi:hypothetical protein